MEVEKERTEYIPLLSIGSLGTFPTNSNSRFTNVLPTGLSNVESIRLSKITYPVAYQESSLTTTPKASFQNLLQNILNQITKPKIGVNNSFYNTNTNKRARADPGQQPGYISDETVRLFHRGTIPFQTKSAKSIINNAPMFDRKGNKYTDRFISITIQYNITVNVNADRISLYENCLKNLNLFTLYVSPVEESVFTSEEYQKKLDTLYMLWNTPFTKNEIDHKITTDSNMLSYPFGPAVSFGYVQGKGYVLYNYAMPPEPYSFTRFLYHLYIDQTFIYNGCLDECLHWHPLKDKTPLPLASLLAENINVKLDNIQSISNSLKVPIYNNKPQIVPSGGFTKLTNVDESTCALPAYIDISKYPNIDPGTEIPYDTLPYIKSNEALWGLRYFDVPDSTLTYTLANPTQKGFFKTVIARREEYDLTPTTRINDYSNGLYVVNIVKPFAVVLAIGWISIKFTNVRDPIVPERMPIVAFCNDRLQVKNLNASITPLSGNTVYGISPNFVLSSQNSLPSFEYCKRLDTTETNGIPNFKEELTFPYPQVTFCTTTSTDPRWLNVTINPDTTTSIFSQDGQNVLPILSLDQSLLNRIKVCNSISTGTGIINWNTVPTGISRATRASFVTPFTLDSQGLLVNTDAVGNPPVLKPSSFDRQPSWCGTFMNGLMDPGYTFTDANDRFGSQSVPPNTFTRNNRAGGPNDLDQIYWHGQKMILAPLTKSSGIFTDLFNAGRTIDFVDGLTMFIYLPGVLSNTTISDTSAPYLDTVAYEVVSKEEVFRIRTYEPFLRKVFKPVLTSEFSEITVEILDTNGKPFSLLNKTNLEVNLEIEVKYKS